MATVLEQPAGTAIDLPAVLHALSDPARLAIVRALAAGRRAQLRDLRARPVKATRSHHFKVLREAGVTHTRLEGTTRRVSLRRDDLDARFPGLLDAVLRA